MDDIRGRAYHLTRLGLVCGAILGAWTCVVMIAQGSFTIVIRNQSVSGFFTVAAYLIGMPAAGLMVAIMFPLHRWLVGSIVLGIAAVVPFAVAIMISFTGLTWTRADWITTLIFSLVFGGILGPAFRSLFRDPATPAKTNASR